MELLIYLAKVNLYWMLFYACYWLVLRRHTFFQWNRAYLLGTLLISFALPLLDFSGQAPVIEPAVYVAAAIPVYISTPESESYFSNWTQFLWIIQGLGAVLMFSKIAEAIQDLRSLIRQGETIEFDQYTLVLLPHDETGSFSFLKWVVVNRNDYENHFDLILNHEAVHIKQKHSIDILLIELLKTAFWFNPILWFYKKSLQEVHEFLADEQAPNRDQYTEFLVSYALNTPVASLTNHFFNSSLLLNRVQMIYKNRNSYWSLGKYLIIVPIIGMMVLLTAARERLLDSVSKYASAANATVSVEGTVKNSSGAPIPGANIVVKNGTRGTATDAKGHFKLDSVPANSSIVISHINYVSQEIKIGASRPDRLVISLKNADNTLSQVVVGPATQELSKSSTAAESEVPNKIFTAVEQKPEFPGGQPALSQYLSQNIVYPSEAVQNKTQGEVTVSFIVNEKGYVRSPKIVKGLGSGIDEEAVRVVLNMPQWTPGIQSGRNVPVKYTMPIKFDLLAPVKVDTDKRQGFFPQREMPVGVAIRGAKDFTFGEQKPLIFIDGVRQKERGTDGLKDIKTETIQSMSIIKGQTAISGYGYDGNDGVILITTKK